MSDHQDRTRRKALRDAYKSREREKQQAQLGLSRDQLENLIAYLEEGLARDACDHTLRRSIDWARRQGLDPDRVSAGLEALGGFCDDEVVYNLDPDEIFKTPMS